MASLGVYLHVPFCERVCPYCDFAVVGVAGHGRKTLSPVVESRYVDALLSELEERRSNWAGLELASVYFGGGTPSLLSAGSIGRLLAGVRAAFDSGTQVEVTVEVNPSTTERERLPGFRAAGVTRLSIGLQSFDDTVLQRLGRAHRADEGRKTLAAARDAGFEQLSVDLLFGVPGQTEAALARDLAELSEFAPPHVSAYGLTIESGTPYARGVAGGQLVLPEPDTAAVWTERVWSSLEAAGLHQYEISSFARPGSEAVHNQRYWRRLPVLGLGMGAWSSEPRATDAPFGTRRANVRELAPYLEAVEQGRAPDAGPPEVLTEKTARFEATFLALRTRAGLRAAPFEAEFGVSPREIYGSPIDELCAGGMLREAENGDLRLTRRGRLLSDSVLGRLL
ncbi:MAG: radical SAM family heme chaperone HemW [Myxococcota bacterium]